MKFPKRLRHRGKGKVLATIYRKPNGYLLYWRQRVDGKPQSRFKDFQTYSEAKRAGDAVVSGLAKGTVLALSPGQAADAQNALEELQRHYQRTGKRLSLRFVAAAYCEAARKLHDQSLNEAVDSFLSGQATIKRLDLKQAVEQFIAMRETKTVAKDGRRPQLSGAYCYIVAMWLREFAQTFPNTAVCDLNKDLLNAYMAQHSDVTPRTRNGRRTVTKMFLRWCVRQDYLSRSHRLFEADGMVAENAHVKADVELYTPKELRDMLDTAGSKAEFVELVPVLTLCGLGGLRLQEAVRLTWEDVWRVPGHVEITSSKSKTRQRRLVTVCRALKLWLAPYRDLSGPVWTHNLDRYHDTFNALLASVGIAAKRNGLRHAFCTYHYAQHANESLTAQQAGNSPQMVHAHYKGLATAVEAKKWFNVCPAKAGNVIQLPKEKSL